MNEILLAQLLGGPGGGRMMRWPNGNVMYQTSLEAPDWMPQAVKQEL